jgi:acyl carrier protein
MEDQIKSILASVLNIDPSSINENSSSKTLEKWDSLYHMNIIIAVEEAFGITFEDEEIPGLTSFKGLATAIEKHKKN